MGRCENLASGLGQVSIVKLHDVPIQDSASCNTITGMGVINKSALVYVISICVV